MATARKRVEVFFTAQWTGDRLARKRPLSCDPRDTETENQVITIHEDIRFQKLLGFGGAFTEAAAHTFSQLPPGPKQVVRAISAGRAGGYQHAATINSCDFPWRTRAWTTVGHELAVARTRRH
jgi:glucosylceramidase